MASCAGEPPLWAAVRAGTVFPIAIRSVSDRTDHSAARMWIWARHHPRSSIRSILNRTGFMASCAGEPLLGHRFVAEALLLLLPNHTSSVVGALLPEQALLFAFPTRI